MVDMTKIIDIGWKLSVFIKIIWYKTDNLDHFRAYLSYRFYRIFRFKWLLSNRFYRASINWLPLTIQNVTDHLSVSAGVWTRPGYSLFTITVSCRSLCINLLLEVFFFLLVSHLRLIQRKDETVVGWLSHVIVITLYQQQPSG